MPLLRLLAKLVELYPKPKENRRLSEEMKIHEYQAKELLKQFAVPVPRGIVARSPDEAYTAAK